MGQTERVGGQRPPQLLFHPRQRFRERRRLAGQAPMVFPPGQIVALHNTRGPRGPRGRCCQLSVKRSSSTTYNLARHLPNPSFDAPLQHVSRAQARAGRAPPRGIPPTIASPLGLIPCAIGGQPRTGGGGPLITGTEGTRPSGHGVDPRQQPVGLRLRPFADHQRHDQAPDRCTGHPDPRSTGGGAAVFGHDQVLLFGMHKTPQFIQLTFAHVQLAPRLQGHPPALVGRTVPPATDRSWINLDKPCRPPDRMACRPCADRAREHGWGRIQIEGGRALGPRDPPATAAPPGVRMAVTAAMLQQQRLPNGPAVGATGALGAVPCVPVHSIRSDH